MNRTGNKTAMVLLAIMIVLLGADSAFAQAITGETGNNPPDMFIDTTIPVRISQFTAFIIVILIGFPLIFWAGHRKGKSGGTIGAILLAAMLGGWATPALAQERMVPVNTPEATESLTPAPSPAPTPAPVPAPTAPKTVLDEAAVAEKGTNKLVKSVRDAIGETFIATQNSNEALNKLVNRANWLIFIGVVLIALLVIVVNRLNELGAFIQVVRGTEETRPAATRAGGPTVVGIAILALGLGLLAAPAFAQTVTSVTPDAWAQGGTTAVTITGTKLGDVESLQLVNGVVASDIKATASKVTAKLTLASNAVAGPGSFNLIRKGGAKVDSGKVTFTVFTADEARVVDYLQQKIASQQMIDSAARRSAAQLRLDLDALVKAQSESATKADLNSVRELVSHSLTNDNALGRRLDEIGINKASSDAQFQEVKNGLQELGRRDVELVNRLSNMESRFSAGLAAAVDQINQIGQETVGTFNRRALQKPDAKKQMCETYKGLNIHPPSCAGQ